MSGENRSVRDAPGHLSRSRATAEERASYPGACSLRVLQTRWGAGTAIPGHNTGDSGRYIPWIRRGSATNIGQSFTGAPLPQMPPLANANAPAPQMQRDECARAARRATCRRRSHTAELAAQQPVMPPQSAVPGRGWGSRACRMDSRPSARAATHESTKQCGGPGGVYPGYTKRKPAAGATARQAETNCRPTSTTG